MELPITIVIEPPSLAALRAELRCRWLWVVGASVLAVVVGALALVVSVSRAEALATSASTELRIDSHPLGADISIDGHAAGQTPLVLGIAPGAHQVQLTTAGAVEASYTVEVQPPGGRLEAVLWRRTPQLTRLRPAVPGARLTSVRLQPDGRVLLSLGLGSDDDLQAWHLDPSTGARAVLQGNLPGVRLAVAPASHRIVTIGREIGPPRYGSSPLQSVAWLWEAALPTVASKAIWQAPAGDSLTDLIWTPDERRLLAVTEQEGAQDRRVRTRVWLIDLESPGVRLLYSLPSHIVPGAFVWRPDGRAVALLAHSGMLNALCLLDLDGEFRYLADLEPSTALPLPYLAVAWSADSQRLAFAAPRQDPTALPSTWLQTQSRSVVSVADASGSTPRVLAETDARAVAWREDGQLLALTRVRDSGLAVVRVDAGGREERLLEVPFRQSDAYAAQWDVGSAQVVLASAAGGEVEYWLVRLGLEGQP